MPVAIDGGIVVQFGARRRRKEWQQSVGAHFDGVFNFRGVWVDVGVFWNDSTSHGTRVVKDARCRGKVGHGDGEMLPGETKEKQQWAAPWREPTAIVGKGGTGTTRISRTAAKINVEEGNYGFEMAKEHSSIIAEKQQGS